MNPRFVHAHISLCGHKMHEGCWNKWGVTGTVEWECPLCKHPGNCGVVDFEDVKDVDRPGKWEKELSRRELRKWVRVFELSRIELTND